MGNIVQCCHSLSNYFKCKDAPARGGAERSPLLSSEESECESPSLPDDEDDLLTVSTGVTNPTLEPEHFLFPDIILSSNLGGDVTLVEPMVCLLVSEEEEGGVRVEEPGGERSNRGRHRGYSEVETQTEVETQIGMGVQTQTESQAEVQAQAKIFMCHNETMEREVNTQTHVGTAKETVVDVWEEHERRSEIVTKMPSEKQKTRIDSGTWSDFAVVELEVPGKVGRQTEKNKLAFGGMDKEAEREEVKEKHIHEELTPLTKHAFQTEQNPENTDEENVFKLHLTLQTQENVKDGDPNLESESTSVMLTEYNVYSKDENVAAVESRANIQPTKRSINATQTVESFGPAECHVDPPQQSDQDNEQTTDQNIIHTNTNINLSEDHAADPSISNADHIQCQEKLLPPKKEEDDNKADLRHRSEMEAALPQVEEQEGEGAVMFSVDRRFLAAPHVKSA